MSTVGAEVFWMEKQKGIWIRILITLLSMFVLTAVLLLIAAALVYYVELSSKTARMIITAIYIIVGLSGGFMMGKMMRVKKFLWGILAGLCYFGCLMLISLIINGGVIEDVIQMLITFVLIIASSMIGGMVS